jgi:branched-chain amino acid aminotransferase
MSTSNTALSFTVEPANRLDPAAREAILVSPGFGKHFTDHMVSIEWTSENGWADARVMPYGPLVMDPASSVFHYGQEVFEGLKVYRHSDGSIWSFRPEENARRLNASAARLALPELPVETFVESLRQLVAADADWVPTREGDSLYVRPFMIADESFLGVRSAHKVRFMVIACPVGPYFEAAVKPVSIWLSTTYSRAGQGGTGEAKCGGNYAASLLPLQEAYAQGCAQVLFTDTKDNDTIDELGGMNIFFVIGDDTLVTPKLNGNILRGITRNSILQLARNRGLNVEERDVTVSEWRAGVESGTITEVFACGTAAVITPIGELKAPDFSIGSPTAEPGTLTMSLREELTNIQHGLAEDRHGWLVRLDR